MIKSKNQLEKKKFKFENFIIVVCQYRREDIAMSIEDTFDYNAIDLTLKDAKLLYRTLGKILGDDRDEQIKKLQEEVKALMEDNSYV